MSEFDFKVGDLYYRKTIRQIICSEEEGTPVIILKEHKYRCTVLYPDGSKVNAIKSSLFKNGKNYLHEKPSNYSI